MIILPNAEIVNALNIVKEVNAKKMNLNEMACLRNFKSSLKEISNAHNKSVSRNSTIRIRKEKAYGKIIEMDGVKIALDCWHPEAEIIFISHAHMDHIPIIPKTKIEKIIEGHSSTQFICSKITKAIAKLRTNNKFHFEDSAWLLGNGDKYPQKIRYKGLVFHLLENGHTYGATSLYIEGSRSLFFTGDFIVEARKFSSTNEKIKGLEPQKCDILITECTYGDPQFIFPPFSNLQRDLNSIIESYLDKGRPIIILAYAFGKSQYILNMLKDRYKILLERNIARCTRELEAQGIRFNAWEPYGDYGKRNLLKTKDYVLIIPPYSIFKEPYKTLVSKGEAALVFPSGKGKNDNYLPEIPIDERILLSAHADSPQLTNFIQSCEPKEIYLEHGLRLEAYAYYLSKHLGSKFLKILN